MADKVISIKRGEGFARRLADALRAHGILKNDMHLVGMVDSAMDEDNDDVVDVGGYLDGYVVEDDSEEVDAPDDDEPPPPPPPPAPAKSKPAKGRKFASK